MAKLKFCGPLHRRVASFLTLNRIAIGVGARHLMGRKIAPDWDMNTEIGIRFWRHQFTRAMKQADMSKGRAIFDSLQTLTDDVYPHTVEPCRQGGGRWITPENCTSEAALLYLHGGGYTFNGPISDRFAAMLAHHTQAHLYMPQYRLTPEHPHPAQAEDAYAAWKHVTEGTPADLVVIIGDSAGGHMVLTLLQSLKEKGERQPALCIALCPWTDIGARGESLTENDHYDLVQGWMALKFGEWLDPEGSYGRKALSPIASSYAGLAPIYIQAGGREVLRDMIIEFADVQADSGGSILLDLWEDMPHNFQAYDSMKSSATQALTRIGQAVAGHADTGEPLAPMREVTQVASGSFSGSQ